VRAFASVLATVLTTEAPKAERYAFAPPTLAALSECGLERPCRIVDYLSPEEWRSRRWGNKGQLNSALHEALSCFGASGNSGTIRTEGMKFISRETVGKAPDHL